MASLSSTFDSSASQRRWVGQISHFLEKEIKVDISVPVSIFRVPTTLSVHKPEAYVPRVIGLSPYHHFDPDLYEMQRYKFAAASRLHKEFQSIEFRDLVSKLVELEHDIRASYHKYLDIDVDTLIWIMSIDGLFLVDMLKDFGSKDDQVEDSSAPATAQLVDSAGKKLSHDAVVGDIMMLENQIPIFFLSKMLSTLCKSHDVTTKMLPSMLIGFCKSVSPLKLKDDYPLSEVSQHTHLLDLLYHLTVPKLDESYDIIKVYEQQGGMSFVENDDDEDTGNSNEIFSSLWTLSTKLKIGFIGTIAQPVKMLANVPWNMVTKLASSSKKGKYKHDKEGSIGNTKPPIIEEIIIPSVSNLCDAGVDFIPTDSDVTSIQFDERCKKFYLPVITLNVNTEVILRNLVAYEAANLSEALVLARYTELMNGIIDTARDAKILREKNILVNSLKSDAEVADFFNGMSRSIRLTNVLYIDKTIADVNKYYHGTPRVRLRKYMKKYIFGSWRVLTLLATIVFMFLMAVQSFCSVYSCPRIVHRTGLA